MGKIKSSWEIAQEKTRGLDKISDEELKKYEQEKYREIGQALANRFFSGTNTEQIAVELEKFNEKERPYIGGSLTSMLINSISLDNSDGFEKIMNTLHMLNITQINSQAVQRYKALVQEYEKSVKEKTAEIEKKQRDILHRLRISGNAVGEINIKADKEGQKALEEIAHPFVEQLIEIKKELFPVP